jgi:hypothetical protein
MPEPGPTPGLVVDPRVNYDGALLFLSAWGEAVELGLLRCAGVGHAPETPLRSPALAGSSLCLKAPPGPLSQFMRVNQTAD